MSLGSVRSEKVKSAARELFKRYPSKFTTDYAENKKTMASMLNVPSKKLRNTIAGYITRLVILSQTEETPEVESN